MSEASLLHSCRAPAPHGNHIPLHCVQAWAHACVCTLHRCNPIGRCSAPRQAHKHIILIALHCAGTHLYLLYMCRVADLPRVRMHAAAHHDSSAAASICCNPLCSLLPCCSFRSARRVATQSQCAACQPQAWDLLPPTKPITPSCTYQAHGCAALLNSIPSPAQA